MWPPRCTPRSTCTPCTSACELRICAVTTTPYETTPLCNLVAMAAARVRTDQPAAHPMACAMSPRLSARCHRQLPATPTAPASPSAVRPSGQTRRKRGSQHLCGHDSAKHLHLRAPASPLHLPYAIRSHRSELGTGRALRLNWHFAQQRKRGHDYFRQRLRIQGSCVKKLTHITDS